MKEFKKNPYIPHTEGVWEQGAEEDIRTEEEWGDRRTEKTT
jgi:hypothetical protein